MEKVEKMNLSFVQKLKTPLGLGAAILVSTGIGITLKFLSSKNKVEKDEENITAKSEYQILLEQIQDKLKEEETESYSNELLKMVYECAPLITREEYKKLIQGSAQRRMQVLDNIPEYESEFDKLNQKVMQLLGNAFVRIIKEAGGSEGVFKISHQQGMSKSEEIQQGFENVIKELKSEEKGQNSSFELTAELVKEICAYQEGAYKELIERGLKNHFKSPMSPILWVTDNLNRKFGIDTSSVEYKAAFEKLTNSDQELQKVVEKHMKVISDLLGKIFG